MTTLNDPIKNLTAKAGAAITEALNLAAAADHIIQQAPALDNFRTRVSEAQQQVQYLTTEIERTKAVIINERKPLTEELEKCKVQLSEADAQVEMLNARIRSKEEEIVKLEKSTTMRIVPGLGELTTPDLDALTQALALKTETAGLYTLLGTAKGVKAVTEQNYQVLETNTRLIPVEADPRMTALYAALDAAKTALKVLIEHNIDGVKALSKSIFSTENKKQLVELARKNIKTGLPAFLEEAMFNTAIDKAEQALLDLLPPEVIDILNNKTQGIPGDIDHLIDRLFEKIKDKIELPLLDPGNANEFSRMVIDIIARSLKKGQLLDNAIAKA